MTDVIKYGIVEKKIKQFVKENNFTYDHLSILKWYLTTEFKLDVGAIEEYITDGADDKGVDALYYNTQDQTLSIHIIQSKFCMTHKSSNKNFPSNELLKIQDFIKELFNNDNIITENSKIKRIHQTLIELMPNYSNIELTIHLLSNGEPLADLGLKKYVELFDSYGSLIKAKFVHLTDLYEWLSLSNITKTGEVHIPFRTNNLLERLRGDINAVVLTINAKYFVENILCNTEKKIRDGIFDSNIRQYLTQYTPVNKDIEATLSDKNESPYFWFYNNGITIICEDLNYNYDIENKGIKIINPQIINGAQTANNLYNIYMNKMFSENLEKADVLLKIVNKSDDKDFSLKITTATNNQNRIYPRDIKAHDSIQIELEEFLLLNNIRYIRKRGDNGLQKDNKYKYFYILDIAQVVLAYMLGEPHKSKTSSDKVFNNDELYNSIFNSNLDKNILVEGLNYFDFINSHINTIKISTDKAMLSYGKYMILHIVKITKSFENDIKTNVENAINIYQQAYAQAEENKSFYTFSRSSKSLKMIESVIAGYIENPQLF